MWFRGDTANWFKGDDYRSWPLRSTTAIVGLDQELVVLIDPRDLHILDSGDPAASFRSQRFVMYLHPDHGWQLDRMDNS